MIHLLEVGPDTKPESIAKQTRKLAMTGGFEVALKPDLSEDSLWVIARNFAKVIQADPNTDMKRKSSTAYRIIKLISEQPQLPLELKNFVSEVLK